MNAKHTVLFAMTALVFGVGCAKENSADAPAPVVVPQSCVTLGTCPMGTPTPPPGATPLPSYDSGSTAELRLSGGSATLAKLFYNSLPNSPTNLRINIDVSRDSESVIISYQDGGVVHEAALGVVHPDSGTTNKKYNAWVNHSGKMVWKGFFQDKYGAVVLVIDRFLSQGDGQSGNLYGGSIWFQNFDRYAPNFGTQGPLKMCWEITLGPYDCRSFISGNNVVMSSSMYPNNHGPNAQSYTKLGEFDGIDGTAAGFN